LPRVFRQKPLLLLAAALFLAASGLGLATAPGGRFFKESVSSLYYGELRLNYRSPVTSQDLGLPVYPKAKLLRSWRYGAREKDGRPQGYLAQGFFQTSDRPEKVAQFYRAKLGADWEAKSSSSETVFSLHRGEKVWLIRISPGSKNGAAIELSRADKTKPSLLSPDYDKYPPEAGSFF
jgi:hypothetical protein